MTTFNTIEDLERILSENEDWRNRIRRLLLTDELLTLPERHAEFVTEMRSFVAEMNSFVAEMNAFVAEMNAFVAEMRSFVAETNRRLTNLEEHAETTDRRLTNLEEHAETTDRRLTNLEIDVDRLRGDSLEGKLTGVVPPLLARTFAVRRVFITWSARGYAQSYRIQPFEQQVEAAVDAGEISDADEVRLRATDLVVRSQRTSDRTILWFAVEASGVINSDDIERARHSANALQKAFSQDAAAIVYGYRIRDEDRRLASDLDVRVFLHSD